MEFALEQNASFGSVFNKIYLRWQKDLYFLLASGYLYNSNF